MAAEDGGYQVGERLSGSCTGFRQQYATPVEDVRYSRRHLTLSRSRFEIRDRARKGTIVCKCRVDRGC
jgi:hypothetical protein